MKNIYYGICLLLCCCMSISSWAQTTVSGTVNDATGQPLPGANIVIVGTVTGTITDLDGNFSLTTKQAPPFDLSISMMGYDSQTLNVDQSNQTFNVSLADKSIMGGEIVISASRMEENILQSPVSIEKMDALAIRQSSAPSFYDAIENLKGAQLNTNSLTFKSVNTRGFATFANVRFVQVIDGMDNAAPGLNFPAGNVVGISELDVNSVELVPGAASALYGPNAFNGILFMNSKSPFDYQGLSAMVKGGVTVQDAAGVNPMGQAAVRWAKAWNNKFAVKFNVSYLQGTDWHATDLTEEDPLYPVGTPGYDGVNLYGDEIKTVAPLIDTLIARTPYAEADIMDYNASSFKADAAVHYRLGENAELLANYRYGFGNTIYQGANRYGLKNFNLQQIKGELRGDNYFARLYTTLENAGDSYDSRFGAWNINRTWKGDLDWVLDYVLAYAGVTTAAFPDYPANDHDAARAFADNNLLNGDNLDEATLSSLNNLANILGLTGYDFSTRNDLPRAEAGTPEFEAVREEVLARADLGTGAKFIDKTNLVHGEVMYNFKNEIPWFGLQMGASYRQYNLNSAGTIFNDANQDISIWEYGAYAQATKSIIDERLKLTGSVRYDKNQNFEGRFSPRASAVLSLGAQRQHNFRGSFQTGFRNPDTQSQFIALDLGVANLVGGTEENINTYFKEVFYFDAEGNATSRQIPGIEIYENSYTQSSVNEYNAGLAQGVDDPSVLRRTNLDFIKPERIRAYEIGYKGIIQRKLQMDVSVYANEYDDFQANTFVLVPTYGDIDEEEGLNNVLSGNTTTFFAYSNATGKVYSFGTDVSLAYSLPSNFAIGGNYSFADLRVDEDADPDLVPGFNTPKHRFKLNFGNRGFGKDNRLGFNINYRWADTFLWQASFGDGVVDVITSLDAMVSYKIPSLKTIVKVGGSNILGKEFIPARGTGAIGSTYFISLTFDEFFN